MGRGRPPKKPRVESLSDEASAPIRETHRGRRVSGGRVVAEPVAEESELKEADDAEETNSPTEDAEQQNASEEEDDGAEEAEEEEEDKKKSDVEEGEKGAAEGAAVTDGISS